MIANAWHRRVLLFLALWVGLLIVGRDRLLRDPGTFWHTVAGQRMLESKQLIRTDPFSFTEAGQPWLARQWLSELAMAWLHRIGGLDSLLVATATLLAWLFAWLFGRLTDRGLPPGLALCVMILAMGASAHHFHARPHLVSMIGMALTCAALCDVDARRRPISHLFWLILLFVVWTNAHDGVLGGIATVALTIAGWLGEGVWAWVVARRVGRCGGDRWVGPAQRSPTSQPTRWACAALVPPNDDSSETSGSRCIVVSVREVLMLGAFALLCVTTSLLNPYGIELPRAWFSLMNSKVLPAVMAEHGPLWSSPGMGLVLLFAAVYVAVLLAVPWRRWRVTWLVPLVWLFLAWGRIRHAPLFAIAACVSLANILPEVGWVRRMVAAAGLNDPEPSANRAWRISGPLGFATLALGVALAVQSLGWQATLIGRGWTRLDAAYWPTELLVDLREIERQRPDGTPIFNDMLFGGFLIYHTPKFRVFIDDRCELYGDAGLLKYVEARERHPDRIDEWADQFKFELALTESGSGFDEYLSRATEWQVVRRSSAGALYRRTGSAAK
ncbi:MAG: hypothetical protein HZA46_10555 [Planctomycetales bacterium]|nr:hypothetical protein [Planctomycetales bacterium]